MWRYYYWQPWRNRDLIISGRRKDILARRIVEKGLQTPKVVATHLVLCSILLIGLASCKSVKNYGIDVDESAAVASSNFTAGSVDAILSPARDLNLRRTPIPEELQDVENVYLKSPPKGCRRLAREILALNDVLGKDDDEPAEENDTTLSTQVGEQTAKRTLDLIASTATSLLPARDIVRQVTGAARHEKELRAAYIRGAQRRSYLKGIGQAIGCKYPAAPMSGQEERKSIITIK